jgi:hypothetical protein
VRRALELRITALNVALLALCVLTLIAAIAADQACFDYHSLLYAPACPLGESLHAVCAACLALRFGLFIIGTHQEPSVVNDRPSFRVLYCKKQNAQIVGQVALLLFAFRGRM